MEYSRYTVISLLLCTALIQQYCNTFLSSWTYSVVDLSAVVCFILFTGQSQLICSSESVAAQAGENVILPCRLDPPISASSRTVEWTRPGLDPEYIHVHQDGRLVYQSQNPLYSYRTTLFVDQLVNGNVSLKIFNVKMSDAGKYKCFLPSLWKEAFIQLTVGEKTLFVMKTRITMSEDLLNWCFYMQQSEVFMLTLYTVLITTRTVIRRGCLESRMIVLLLWIFNKAEWRKF